MFTVTILSINKDAEKQVLSQHNKVQGGTGTATRRSPTLLPRSFTPRNIPSLEGPSSVHRKT